MKKLFSPSTRKLILLIISQILLRTTSISEILTNCKKGVLLYIMSSMFTVFAILLLDFGIYHLLLDNGFSKTGALSMIFLLLVLTALALYSLAHHHIKKAKKLRRRSIFANQDLGEKIESLVESFLDNLISNGKK